MKCSSCGAEIGNSKVCEFCGTQITLNMQKEQEQLNKSGCPKCGSTNIQFKRENQGEIRGKNSKKIVHSTVGFCKDCGTTWYPESTSQPKKRKTWLWVLGWLFIFPVPLTIILLNKKDMKPALKYALIAVSWLVYLLIGLSGGSSDGDANATSLSSDTAVSSLSTANTAVAKNTSFVLSWNEVGEYGEKVTMNADTDLPMTFISFHIPTGVYDVRNKSSKNTTQVTVYSGIEFDGQYEQFVCDGCADPIVVAPGEKKQIAVKDGQFIKLSDGGTDIEFTKL